MKPYDAWADDLLQFGLERYTEGLQRNFAYLASLRGWPRKQFRALRRFFTQESTPAYWSSLPPEEQASQLVLWVLAENPDAPSERWAGLDVFGQARAALAWLDEKEG